MKENNLLKKGLAFAAIVLFVGASIVPSISGNIVKTNSVSNWGSAMMTPKVTAIDLPPRKRSSGEKACPSIALKPTAMIIPVGRSKTAYEM